MTPAQLTALFETARQQHKQDSLEEAAQTYRRVLAEKPNHTDAMQLLGLLEHQDGRPEQGLELIEKAIAIGPVKPSYLNHRGNVLRGLERLDDAQAAYREALERNPRYVGAWYNLGGVLEAQNHDDEALSCYQRTLELQPEHQDAAIAIGMLRQIRGDYVGAEQYFRALADELPESARVRVAVGDARRAQGRMREAAVAYRAAVQVDPDYALGHNSLGAVVQMLGYTERAEACFRTALTLEPEMPQALYNLARALEDLHRPEEALEMYERALVDESDNAAQVRCYRDLVHLKLGRWQDYEAMSRARIAHLERLFDSSAKTSVPALTLNYFEVPARIRLAAAKRTAQAHRSAVEGIAERCHFVHRTSDPPRLRIGFVSPDLRQHAVGLLISEMFGLIDRTQFEVNAYSLVDVQDACREEIERGCDQFLDISRMSLEDTARRIHADGVHVLIDLGGYTSYTRTELIALQAAPVQAHHLGYLDTMGADFTPYVIADRHVIPEWMSEDFSEAVVRLPHSFAPVSKLPMAERPGTRAEVGLPDDAFVFCCFNAWQKIEPSVFDAWMEILVAVPDSVLWLFEGDTGSGRENLRQEAQARGVAGERLHFAPRRPVAEYMRQHRLADLFLDTFVYNAGATAACALSAGLPVLTRPGQTFLSRMGASLVIAAGVPALVCSSTAEYVERAVHLATHPEVLAAHASTLTARNGPLFDLAGYVQHLESAYHAMWCQYRDGVAPSRIDIPES